MTIEDVDDEQLELEHLRRKLRRAKLAARDLRGQLAEAQHIAGQQLRDQGSELKAVRAELAAVKRDWRPVPMAHPWQPKDPRCQLCDEPRDAARHTAPPAVPLIED